jgi:hypothetical protein
LFQGAGPSENSYSSCPLIGKEEEKKGAGDRQTDRQHTFQKHSNVCKDYIRNSGTLCKTHLHSNQSAYLLYTSPLLRLFVFSLLLRIGSRFEFLRVECVFLAFKDWEKI